MILNKCKARVVKCNMERMKQPARESRTWAERKYTYRSKQANLTSNFMIVIVAE